MSIYVGSLCKGFVLGSTVIGLSFVLDRTTHSDGVPEMNMIYFVISPSKIAYF